jgi:phosphinothricin acetyltransferase
MGFRFTAENSIYVAEESRGQGLGGRLLEPLIPAAAEIGIRAILAAIDAQNTVSLKLHARFGFEQVGLFKRVGFKFDRWLDVAYLERSV